MKAFEREKEQKTKPFCTLVVARVSSSNKCLCAKYLCAFSGPQLQGLSFLGFNRRHSRPWITVLFVWQLPITHSLAPPWNTLTSLNEEVRPFSQAIIAFGDFPLFLPLAITAFGGSGGFFSLAILAFRAFRFIVPKYYYRLGEMDKRSLDSLI